MRIIGVLALLLAACGRLPPSDEAAIDAGDARDTPTASDAAPSDAGTTVDASDASKKTCANVGSSECTCGQGETCVIECVDHAPVTCLEGSDCTVIGRQCAVTCVGATTVCRLDQCRLCACMVDAGATCR